MTKDLTISLSSAKNDLETVTKDEENKNSIKMINNLTRITF